MEEKRSRYILVGCGISGKDILERVKEILTKEVVSVVVNSQNLDMAQLELMIKSTDMIFLCCGVSEQDEIIAAGVISELCRRDNVPVIGIALMPTSGAYTDCFPGNIAALRGYIPNLVVLDHSNIVQKYPGIEEEHAVDITHQLIGKLITETADLIDTISLFKLEDVWSYRGR